MPETTFHTTISNSQYLHLTAKNGSLSGFWSVVSYRFGFNGKENPSECEKHQLKLKVIKLKNLFNLFYQDQALCFPTFYRQVDGAFN